MATLTFELKKDKKQIISMQKLKKQMNGSDPDLSLSLIEPQTASRAPIKRQPPKYLAEMKKHELCANKDGKAVKLIPYLCRCSALNIRVFHITWITFFICFFAWFSVTNLAFWIDKDLHITTEHKSIANGLQSLSTVIFRIIFGDFCDKIGARYSYIIVLTISFLSLLSISLLSHNSSSYIIFSVISGVIGSSFVITEFHVTAFFSPKCVGIANALAAGWGNFGGGVAMAITPFICRILINYANIGDDRAWRYTLLIPCLFLLIMIFVYYLYTIDTPKGNISKEHITAKIWCTFNRFKWKRILCDYRLWLLSLSYAICFGIEITVLHYFVDYFVDQFGINSSTAGWLIFAFSFLNLFARGFGGYLSDILSEKYHLQGKVYSLFFVLQFEAFFLALFAFSSFHYGYSILMMLFFSCYVQIAEGIVFSIVPCLPHKKYMGLCMGIVGAGGNLGPFIYSILLFKNVPMEIPYVTAWIICAISIFVLSFTVLFTKFTQKEIDLDLKLIKLDYFTSMESSKSSKQRGDAAPKNVGFVIH